jgi:hypothetical protein
MTNHDFDRLTRLLAGSRSRRQALAALGALAAARLHPAHAATQIEIAACGEAGAVCTLIKGCCEGLVCATSTLNPSYGVCVTGEGDMLAVSNDLVVPGSEGITEELAAQVTETSADATAAQSALTAQESEIQARKDARNARELARRTRLQANNDTQQARKDANRAAKQARKEANRAEEQARKDANRAAEQARKDENRNRQLEAREAAEVALGPQLQLELILSAEDDPKTTNTVEKVPVETVKVTNLDDVNIVLTRIESILAPKDGTSLTTSPSRFTLVPGKSYYFVAGLTPADATNDRFDWTNAIACNSSPGAGYLVKAAFSVDSENHDFAILCAGPPTATFVDTPATTPRRKGKRNNQQQKKKKR